MCFDSVRINAEIVKLGILDALFVGRKGTLRLGGVVGSTPTPNVLLRERDRNREHNGELHCFTHSAAHSYAVALYESGNEFLTSLDHQPPHCVVLDLHMPGMTGFEIQRRSHA